MNVLVVGCGRTGSTLAARLAAGGDEVAVLDVDPAARGALPRDFGGRFVTGSALHRPALEAAGIAAAEAVVALTSSDSLNVVVASVARDRYRVPRVSGRLTDSTHVALCRDLGLPMVVAVRMAVDRLYRMVHHSWLDPAHSFGNGESLLVRAPIPDYLEGRMVTDFAVPGEIGVVEVTRAGHSSIPVGTTRLEKGDLVSFVVASRSLTRLRAFLGGRWV